MFKIISDVDGTLIPSYYYKKLANKYGCNYDKLHPPEIYDVIFHEIYSNIEIPTRSILHVLSSALSDINIKHTILLFSRKFTIQSIVVFHDFCKKLRETGLDCFPVVDIKRELSLQTYKSHKTILLHDIDFGSNVDKNYMKQFCFENFAFTFFVQDDVLHFSNISVDYDLKYNEDKIELYSLEEKSLDLILDLKGVLS